MPSAFQTFTVAAATALAANGTSKAQDTAASQEQGTNITRSAESLKAPQEANTQTATSTNGSALNVTTNLSNFRDEGARTNAEARGQQTAEWFRNNPGQTPLPEVKSTNFVYGEQKVWGKPSTNAPATAQTQAPANAPQEQQALSPVEMAKAMLVNLQGLYAQTHTEAIKQAQNTQVAEIVKMIQTDNEVRQALASDPLLGQKVRGHSYNPSYPHFQQVKTALFSQTIIDLTNEIKRMMTKNAPGPTGLAFTPEQVRKISRDPKFVSNITEIENCYNLSSGRTRVNGVEHAFTPTLAEALGKQIINGKEHRAIDLIKSGTRL